MKKFSCRLCHRSYSSSRHLTRHYRSKLHLSMKSSVFRSSVPVDSALLHEKKITGDHNSMPKFFTCPCQCVEDPSKQCPKVYEALSSLRKHTVLIHGAHYSHANGNGSVTYLKGTELLIKQAAYKKQTKSYQSQLTVRPLSHLNEGSYGSSEGNQLSSESVGKFLCERNGSIFQNSGGPVASENEVSIKCEPDIIGERFGEKHQEQSPIAENSVPVATERSEHQVDNNTTKLHLQKRHKKFLHRCTNCQRSFAAAANFQQHLLMYSVESSGGEFRWLCHPKAKLVKKGCTKQGEKFRPGSAKFSSGKHASSSSTTVDEGEKGRLCNICGKTYSSIKSLNSHKRRHYRVGMQAFQCQCGLSFLGSRQLTDHMATHFTRGGQTFDAVKTVVHVEAGDMNGESSVRTGEVNFEKHNGQLVKHSDSTTGIVSAATTQQPSSICEANPEKHHQSTADVPSSNSNIIASVIQLLHAANRLTDREVFEEELTKWLPNAPCEEIAGYITCVCTTVQCMRPQLHASNQIIAGVPSSNSNIIASVIQLLHAANRLTDKAVVEQELTKWLPNANCDEIVGYITCICTTVQCLSRQQYVASCNMMTSTVSDSLPKVSHVTSINDDSCLFSKCNDDTTATNSQKVLPSSSSSGAKNHVTSSAVKTPAARPRPQKTKPGSGLRSFPKSRHAVKPPAVRNCYVRLRRDPTITDTTVIVQDRDAAPSNSIRSSHRQDKAAVRCTETRNVGSTERHRLTIPTISATTSGISNNDVSKQPHAFSADIFGNVMLRLCARGGAMNDAVILNELKQWLPSTISSEELDSYLTYIRATAQRLLNSENVNTPGKFGNCLVDKSFKSDGPGSDNDGSLVSLDNLGDRGNEACENDTNIDCDTRREPIAADSLLNSSCERNASVDPPTSERVQCEKSSEIVENSGSSSKRLASTVSVQRFPCLFCENTFAHRSSVVRHINRRHIAQKSLACRTCGGAIGQCWCSKQQQDVAQEKVEHNLEDCGNVGDESTGNECLEQPLENSSVEPPNDRVADEMPDQNMENSTSTISLPQPQIDAASETVLVESETSAEIHQLNQSEQIGCLSEVSMQLTA